MNNQQTDKIMKLLTKEELKILLEKYSEPCISIFIPTHRAGVETLQDPIRFKNMLREVEERLIASGQREPDVKELLNPAQELLKDTRFWQHQMDGLAVFRSPEFFRYYRLPLHLEVLLVIANRFHVKPLLPLLVGDGRFYILALSQNEVRLLQGTRYSVSKIELEGLPQNLAEALKYDYPERQLQFHTRTPGSTGSRRSAVFYAAGDVVGDFKDRILRYFREIDKGLHGLLKDEHAPLVLAGVDYLLPIYKEASTYPHLASEGIEGNPELLSAEELHQRAWPLVQPFFQKAQEDAIAKYNQLSGSNRVSSDVKEVVPAAYAGRVESLFVAIGFQQWGIFDPNTNTVDLHTNMAPGDEDLLDLAAVQTLLHGGSVYTVTQEKIPGDPKHRSLAAIFRY